MTESPPDMLWGRGTEGPRDPDTHKQSQVETGTPIPRSREESPSLAPHPMSVSSDQIPQERDCTTRQADNQNAEKGRLRGGPGEGGSSECVGAGVNGPGPGESPSKACQLASDCYRCGLFAHCKTFDV